MLLGGRRGLHVMAMARVWRPDMNDVDRLSHGGPAKKRGTGSFLIPHRLNSDERPVYEAAKKKGFLQVRGTGYRKGRKGHPLPNIYRQWCDAKAQPCIVIEQDASGGSIDVVVVDLAPLRSLSLSWAVQQCSSLAQAAGARQVPLSERPVGAVPFDAIPVGLSASVEQMLCGVTGSSDPPPVSQPPAPTPEQIAAAEQAVLAQAEAVRQLKAGGRGNSDPQVQSHVQVLIGLKSELQQLLEQAATIDRSRGAAAGSQAGHEHVTDAASSSSTHTGNGTDSSTSSDIHLRGDVSGAGSKAGKQFLDDDHPFACAAIWQLPVMPLFFEAERPVTKQLAKDLMHVLAKTGVRS